MVVERSPDPSVAGPRAGASTAIRRGDRLERPSVVVVSQLAAAPKVALGARIGRLSDARVDQILAGLRFQQASYDR